MKTPGTLGRQVPAPPQEMPQGLWPFCPSIRIPRGRCVDQGSPAHPETEHLLTHH